MSVHEEWQAINDTFAGAGTRLRPELDALAAQWGSVPWKGILIAAQALERNADEPRDTWVAQRLLDWLAAHAPKVEE